MITTYANVSDLIIDIEGASLDIWSEHGRIQSILVSNQPTTQKGFVQLFIRNFNKINRIGADERYTYTLAEFQVIPFIKNLAGLSLYLNTIASTTMTTWDALPQLDKDDYIADAANLVNKNLFVPNWPSPEQLL